MCLYSNREEKSLGQVAMVAKFLYLNKRWSFLCMAALRNKTVAYSFLLLLENWNGHLSQETLLRSRKIATLGKVTSHFSSL